MLFWGEQAAVLEPNTIHSEIDSIIESGVLGRSPVYARLLRYLAAATAEQKTAREIDIAADVFRKGSDFDSNQDSSVRVYVHNLRQRLDRFYQENSNRPGRVSIPKGEYRLDFGAIDTAPLDRKAPADRGLFQSYAPHAAALLLLCNLILLAALFSNNEHGKREVADSLVWAPILGSDRPLLIVVGDYFIFGELDSSGHVSRMIREFNVNSPSDLAALQERQSPADGSYMNLELSYLPQSMAFAMNDVLSIVHAKDKRVTIIPASKLRTSDLKSSDILYLGYISGLGILESYVFAASTLQIGNTYDELLHPDSGRYFLSNAGIPGHRTYQDFALLTTFPGPGPDNHILVAAGMRDAGLIYVAEAMASADKTRQLSERIRSLDRPFTNSYEALYEVVGSDRTSLDAKLIHAAILDLNQIWGQRD